MRCFLMVTSRLYSAMVLASKSFNAVLPPFFEAMRRSVSTAAFIELRKSMAEGICFSAVVWPSSQQQWVGLVDIELSWLMI